MPATDVSKKALEFAAKLMHLQQALQLAVASNKSDDVKLIMGEIDKLDEIVKLQKEVTKETARLQLEISIIIEFTNLEQNALEKYKAEQPAVHSSDMDSLRQEAAYKLALHRAKINQQIDDIKKENAKQEALEAKRLGKRGQLFTPLLRPSYRNYIGGINKEVFLNHSDIKKLTQAIQSNESLIKLKEYILNIIKNQKEIKKGVKYKPSVNILTRFGDWLDLRPNLRVSLSHNLNEVKQNINLELYPIFGKHIDALENYIQALKEAGVSPKSSKQLPLKSDRSTKLRIAEQLCADLIAFEGKNEPDRKADAQITLTAVENLIKENEVATGSRYLHGKGKLDKILKNVKDEIDFSINKHYTEKLKAEHLKDLEKKTLNEAMANGSGHFFRNEMVALTDFAERLSYEFDSYYSSLSKDPMPNPTNLIKIAKQLRILLLNSSDLSDEKLKILKSRIEAENLVQTLAQRKEYPYSSTSGRIYYPKKELSTILEKIRIKIENPKKLRP